MSIAIRARTAFSPRVDRLSREKEAGVGVAVRNLGKSFGGFEAVRDVSFEAAGGRLVALLGPSGSGKSTILRTIAGLESADAGSVTLDGEDVTRLPARRRGVGFVFQHYALFRHMTIRDNIGFGLKVRKLPRAEVRARVDELLDLIRLPGLADRYPSQLSGGQRQRVALARALAPRPRVLLLDEPFGALDAKVREELRTWLRRLHDEVHVTSLFVTHDQREAFEVADEVVVLAEGRVRQIGPPQMLYDRPSDPFVARFLGPVNVLPLRLLNLGREDARPGESLDFASDERAEAYVRPHDLDVLAERDGRPHWTARVVRAAPLGGVLRLDLALEQGGPIQVELPGDRVLNAGVRFRPGDEVHVAPRRFHVHAPSRGVFRAVEPTP